MFGFQPIALEKDKKNPAHRDWQKPTDEDPKSRLRNNSNLGLLLGEPSKGLVDIDLDVPEAVELARHFLPSTPWISGHSENPRSHYWYRVESVLETRKFKDPLSVKMWIGF